MRYSEKQRRIINDILASNGTKRKRVLGASGTGKSLIIAHCAKELSRQGKKVFVCFFNKTLISKFTELCFDNRIMAKDKKIGRNNIIIQNYHKFMYYYVRKRKPSDIESFRRAEFSSEDPKNGYRFSFDISNKMFDYIFVDEMQDMTKNSILNLIDLLTVNGKICVFADKNQRIYEKNQYENEENTLNKVPELPKHVGFLGPWNRLDEIFRANNNIQRTADKFRAKYFTGYGLEMYFMAGEETESNIIYKRGRANPNEAVRVLENEIGIENINQTAILFFTNKEAAEIGDLLSLKGINYITTAYGERTDFIVTDPGVKVSTIKSFKGLEIENVILVINEMRRGQLNPETLKEEVYVGLTRATKKIVIIDQLNDSFLEEIYGD